MSLPPTQARRVLSCTHPCLCAFILATSFDFLAFHGYFSVRFSALLLLLLPSPNLSVSSGSPWVFLSAPMLWGSFHSILITLSNATCSFWNLKKNRAGRSDVSLVSPKNEALEGQRSAPPSHLPSTVTFLGDSVPLLPAEELFSFFMVSRCDLDEALQSSFWLLVAVTLYLLRFALEEENRKSAWFQNRRELAASGYASIVIEST